MCYVYVTRTPLQLTIYANFVDFPRDIDTFLSNKNSEFLKRLESSMVFLSARPSLNAIYPDI